MSEAQLEQVLDMIRGGPDLTAMSPQELRVVYDAMGDITPPHESVTYAAVEANGVPCEVGTAPGARTDATIVYFHGGAYVFGSRKSHRGLVARLGQAAGIRTLAPDYRLAPEHVFPAAVDDAFAVYQWLLAEGTPAERIVFAGDSAGGGLTLGTMLRCKAEGVPMPAGGVLFSPFVDMGVTGDSVAENKDRDFLVSFDGAFNLAALYMTGSDLQSPEASPIFADLTGLPPLLIHVGGHEAILDDSLRLARRAIMADVSVRLRAFPKLPHVWQLFSSLLDEGEESLREAGAFVATQIK
ncbi:alpha/beta hydrolase [Sphingomonas sp. TX0543]|uniref:alpha/beta hydrolase n=1 Tax=Sphingomonas sp. TX0543 TaxID=3399682 RepID=UPI003AFB1D3B